MEFFASTGLTPATSLHRAQEAYTEYLRSVHYIAQVLLEEVEATKGIVPTLQLLLGQGHGGRLSL